MEEAENPFARLAGWLAEAEASEPNDPTAMALATADRAGRPSLRMVLLKTVDDLAAGAGRGVVFYTNLGSRKANELDANPFAALLFHWKSLRRQIRLEGRVEPAGEAEADAYFASRPRLSRLGAWASDQSRPLENRAVLERRLAEADARFPDAEVPRPPGWGGFRLVPDRFEFWRDGKFRLHERIEVTRHGTGWRAGLLYP